MARILSGVPFLVIVAVAGVLAACGRQREAAWPQFRGPSGQGVADAGELPTAWGPESANIRWRAPVPGEGNSSPVVDQDRIYLTTAIETQAGGPLQRAVLAFDVATGEKLWQTEIFRAPRVRGHQLNTNAAPTAVTDGESVYAYFGSHLARLTRDGAVEWSREIDPRYPRHTLYGAASSPILAGDRVIVVQDQEEDRTEDLGWMAAFDRETGEEVWRQEWDNTCCSYSTPLLWRRPGAEEELVFAYSGGIAAHDPHTGERLWLHTHGMTQFVGGLVVDGDVVCALGGAHHNKGNLCVRVTGSGRDAKTEELWYERRRAPEVASPVLYRGRLYAVTQNGVMSCYDLRTGKLHWAEDLTAGRGFRSALVAGDGKVYAQSSWGATVVVDAGTDAFRLLANNYIGEFESNASPAIGGGCLLLRGAGQLYCIEKEAPGSGPAPAEAGTSPRASLP